ncbi:MAG: hypothetical protein AAAB16_19385 [Pseudomonas sp.]|uniref:hypothetical protein n=1 Tax=Pseudomonas sp. TaxID=306 RepID=UPI0030F0D3C4
MRIEYENKFRDVLVFNTVHQFRSPVLQGFILFCTLLAVWGFWRTQGIIFTLVYAAFLYLVIWLIQSTFNCLYLYSRKNHSVLTRHVIELQDGALMEETPYNKSYFFWNGGVHKVVARANRVAIYISPFMAHIIPPEAFSSKEQKLEFIKIVRERIRPRTNPHAEK